MGGIQAWVNENFNAVQTVGIIGTLICTIICLRNDTRDRAASRLAALTEQHSVFWNELTKREDLRRIFLKDVDLTQVPPTVMETEALNTIFVRFETNWQLVKMIDRAALKSFAEDMRQFFSYPLRRAVWIKEIAGRDSKFIEFVERAIRVEKMGDSSISSHHIL